MSPMLVRFVAESLSISTLHSTTPSHSYKLVAVSLGVGVSGHGAVSAGDISMPVFSYRNGGTLHSMCWMVN